MRAGRALLDQLSPAQADAAIGDYLDNHALRVDCGCREERAAVLGVKTCSVAAAGNVRSILAADRIARKWVREFESRHGPDTLVFISTQLLWRSVEDDDPPYEEFTLLAAVNSVLGLKGKVRTIGREMLTARQLGYRTPEIMEVERTLRPGRAPLTPSQLRTRLDRLEGRGLLFRCNANGRGKTRSVVFSTSGTFEDLVQYVKGRLRKRQELRERRGRAQALLMLEESAARAQSPLKNAR
jgi:hypothetical protein